MKRITVIAVAVCAAFSMAAPALEAGAVEVLDLALAGEIQGENAVFTLSFNAEAHERDAVLNLVSGDTGWLGGEMPRHVKLERHCGAYRLIFERRGEYRIRFRFAGNSAESGDWRETSFGLPAAPIRKLRVACDRPDLDIEFPGALNISESLNEEGNKEFTAFLGAGNLFNMRWKPELRKLSAELVVACDANTIAAASVGALKIDNVFTYRISQGDLRNLAFSIPDEVSVTRVRGIDIQDWEIEKQGNERKLLVTLNRPKDDIYRLQVQGEMALPKFPCKLDVPVLTPLGVIRASGFTMLGTDHAIKLIVENALGLTQVDQSAFPSVPMDEIENGPGQSRHAVPSKSRFAYQYANMPYKLTVSADDIVPEYSSDEQLVFSVKDSDLVMAASVELDVRDAPIRELIIETDPGWIAAGVSGSLVSDYDVRDDKAEDSERRLICLYFSEAVMGRSLVDLRLERSMKAEEKAISVPRFVVRGARTTRGTMVVSTEKGLQVKPEKQANLREVHTGSVETRVEGARLAYRYKESNWRLNLLLRRLEPTIYSEMLQLSSIGEGVVYGSSLVTYHIDGAPVRSFNLSIPDGYQNVEFSGRDIRGWERDGNTWTVSLQDKVIGDYTLLCTYDRKFDYDGEVMSVGGMRTEGATTEAGYIVLTGSASLSLSSESADEELTVIDEEEIPQAYLLLISDPVLSAYKYTGKPHSASVSIQRYRTEQLLDQVADHIALNTEISKDGESVTTVTYSVKNLSRQYLVVSLPEDAMLWSTYLIDPRGNRRKVTSMEEGGKTLIPVSRLRNPNMPVRVEVVYAQRQGKFGPLGGKAKFVSPLLPDSHSTFARWSFNIPEGFSVAGTSGNMTAGDSPGLRGLVKTILGVLGAWKIALAKHFPWVLFAAVLVGAICLVVYQRSRGRAFVWQTILLILLVVAAFFGSAFAWLAFDGPANVFPAQRAVGQGVTAQAEVTGDFSVTKTINLAGVDPLVAGLRLTPSWAGRGSSFVILLLGLILGIYLIVRGLSREPRGLLAASLGATLLLVGITELAAVRNLLVYAIATLIPAGLIWRAVRASRRAGLLRPVPPDVDRNAVSAGTNPSLEQTIEPNIHSPADESTAKPREDDGSAGFARVGSLVLLALVGAACAAFAEQRACTPRFENLPAADSLEISIEAPAIEDQDAERSAAFTAVYEFELKDEGSFLLLGAPAVLTSYELDSRDLSLTSEPEGFVLHAEDDGRYRIKLEYVLPVVEASGRWSVSFPVAENLSNRISLHIPSRDLEVKSPSAAMLEKTEDGQEGMTEAAIVYGAAREAKIEWFPRARQTQLEKEVFFCEVNTLALFQPGVVEMKNLVRYRIAQGETKALSMQVPEGMSITSVSAKGLSTWRFDPANKALEALLEKPVSGDFTLKVMGQIGCEGLPYKTGLGVLRVNGAVRQHGALAMAAPDTVGIQVERTEGLNPMNIEDVSRLVSEVMPDSASRPVNIRRAFRYLQVPVSASVEAEQVLPEIRVSEQTAMFVSDEMIKISAQLGITVSRSGVFSVRLGIPEGYDIETLTGSDVSHWDEIAGGSPGEGRTAIVNFRSQAIGLRTINIVAARAKKGMGDKVEVPRISVENELKRTGTMVVSGERGVRMTTVAREGVSETNPRELGIRESGVLAFRLLRPEWSILLRTEIVDPVIRSEVLQRADLSEGMMQCTAYVRYRIDHAGEKAFRLRSPFPDTRLAITGENISKVTEIDSDAGLWEVELHDKVENEYALEVRYQVRDTSRILPLRTENVESQRGHLVIMSSGRMQVKPVSVPPGLQYEDSRSIPAHFGAGDLSDAIYCYSVISPEYELELSAERHDAAEVLAARVHKVRMTSVVSDSGQIMTHAEMDMTLGNLRSLEMSLPGGDSALWSAFVNGKAAVVSQENDIYRIPLEEPVPGEPTSVELVFASEGDKGLFSSKRKFVGPQFGLPLNDIEWNIYAPSGRRYYGFGGTLEYAEADPTLTSFSRQTYDLYNEWRTAQDSRQAKKVMAQVEEYTREGNQKLALKALESAVNYSQNDQAFNEDARIQYRNLAKQQTVVGLVQRRDEMRFERNIQDAGQIRRMHDFKGGNFTLDYAERVQHELEDRENTSLMQLAEKIMDQQDAAEKVTQALKIAVPTHGQQLTFKRSLQIDPDAEMAVSYKVSGGGFTRVIATLACAAIVLAAVRFALGRRIRTA